MSSLMTRIAAPIPVIAVMAVAFLAPLGADNPSEIQQFEPAFTRFNTVAPPPYRAFRKLEAGRPDSGKHGWLEAWTEFQPGQGFRYEVVREGGSEYVRNKVLRGVLKAESELIAKGIPLRAPIVPRNYEVEDGGPLDSGLRRLLLNPVRKFDGVIRGSALFDPAGGGIVRMEGRLTKSPSFWTRDVDVVWEFTKIGDAIVPLELSSTARIVFYGRQPFKMTYEYESIEGRRVDGVALRASLTGEQE